jgi:hypothetical protein
VAHAETSDWTIPLTTAERQGSQRKGGHLCPPDRMCQLCFRMVPPAKRDECCTDCIDEMRMVETVLADIRAVFPDAMNLSLSEILGKLWDHRKSGL